MPRAKDVYANDSNENDCVRGRDGGGAKPCSAARADHADGPVQAGTSFDKFAGLARVVAGKYDWKPGEGVRSVGDVFNLIVTENCRLVETLTGAGGVRGAGRGAQVIAPEKPQEAQKTSYANVQEATEGLSDADLKAPLKLFGRDMTKEDAVRFLLGDQHEHPGQSIAYGALQRCRTAMVEVRRDSDLLGKRAGDYSNTAARFSLVAVS